MLTTDPERSVKQITCALCRRDHDQVTLLIHRDGDAHAVCFVALHDAHEAWFDVILGDFGTDDDPDRVTFGCRVGSIDGQDEPAASLAQAGAAHEDRPLFGRKLSRDDALAHPRLNDFWEVVDYVLTSDPLVNHHLYHAP
jgi:hypothetical protein